MPPPPSHSVTKDDQFEFDPAWAFISRPAPPPGSIISAAFFCHEPTQLSASSRRGALCVCVCLLQWIPCFLLPSDGCSAAGLAVHRMNDRGEKRQRPSSSSEWTEPWGSVWLTRFHPATVCSHCVCVCLFCGRSGCSAPLLQQDAGSAVCSRVCVVPS